MSRHVLGAAAVLAISSLAATAAAQATGTPNHPPPDPLPQPQTQTVEITTTPSLGAATTAAPAPGTTRLHFRTFRDRDRGQVYVRTVQGTYAYLCTSPCSADLPPGAELRVMLGDSEDSHIFNVPHDLGTEVDVEMRAPGKGGLVGGIIMLSIGGIFAIAGIALTALSTEERSGARIGTLTGGLVCLGLGVGLGVPGILLVANRSHEPRVRQSPHRERPGRYGRGETLLGDVAEAQHRDPVTIPVALTPMQLGFAF